MLTFEQAIIKKYWPADDKGDEGEIVRQLVMQTDVDLDNSTQVGELYNSMVRGLVKVTLLDQLTGEEFVLPAVTIRPFNVKQKKVKVGKGADAEITKQEFAALTIVSKIPETNGGQMLADLYRFFNIQIHVNIEELERFETAHDERVEATVDNFEKPETEIENFELPEPEAGDDF